MSSKRKIRWTKSAIGEEQNIYDIVSSMSGWSGMLLDAVCGLLFILSARAMICDVFGMPQADITHTISLVVTALLLSVFMELAGCTSRGKRYGIYAGALIIGVVLCWFSLDNIGKSYMVEAGYKRLANIYLGCWNNYFGTSYGIDIGAISQSSTSWMENIVDISHQVFDATIYMSLYLTIWVAKVTKKNATMALVPILVMVAEMLVGYAPGWSALLMFFVAVLICNSYRWSRGDFAIDSYASRRSHDNVGRVVSKFSWMAVAVCVCVICVGVWSFGRTDAGKIAASGPKFHKFVNELIEDIKNGTLFNFGNSMSEPPTEAKISDSTPRYDNIPVLRLTSSAKLYGTLYLKDFHANTYKDGVWTEDMSKLTALINEHYIKNIDMKREIGLMSANKLCQYYSTDDLKESFVGTSMNIYYYDKNDARAYMPYFATPDMSKVYMRGEGLFVKKDKINSIDVSIWQFSGAYESRASFFESIEPYAWESWYEDYIKAEYTYVEQELKNSIRSIEADVYASFYDKHITNMLNETNKDSLNKAYWICQWLQENTTYTLTPPKLPKDRDPVEFFLTESRQGYCVHYASAAVQLLRIMGVPARYATGYIVDEGDFSEEYKSDDGVMPIAGSDQSSIYTATVLDSRAHAWVEIYLDGIGWVPFEMTKGYTDLDDSNLETPTEPEEPSTEEPSTEEPSTDEPTSEDTSSHEPATEDEPTTESDSSTTSGVAGNGNGDGRSSSLGKIFAVVIPVILVLSAVGLIGYYIYRQYALEQSRLQDNIVNKRTRSVIRKVNHSIYKRLRRTGKILKPAITDDAYCQILKKTYPEIDSIDWNRYINIVKAAAFSKAEFTVEEMEFCLMIGEKIRCRRKSNKV
ncbi:MAG: transglutaminase domain-containing protein [Lachnospiraceae bacterium]|nr:transglutaminase domain-containing protein [Lachnospiraceae bacterium]